MTNWNNLKERLIIDIIRNEGTYSIRKSLKILFFSKSPTTLVVYFRICNFLCNKKKNLIEMLLHCFVYCKFNSLKRALCIELNQHTRIGVGLRIPHIGGGMIVHPQAVIGDYCEIMQGVTIGNNFLKDRNGVATIGNNVTLCAGSKIIGKISVGNNVIVGANSVVTKDIPDNKIAAGIPARVIGVSNYKPVNCE